MMYLLTARISALSSWPRSVYPRRLAPGETLEFLKVGQILLEDGKFAADPAGLGGELLNSVFVGADVSPGIVFEDAGAEPGAEDAHALGSLGVERAILGERRQRGDDELERSVAFGDGDFASDQRLVLVNGHRDDLARRRPSGRRPVVEHGGVRLGIRLRRLSQAAELRQSETATIPIEVVINVTSSVYRRVNNPVGAESTRRAGADDVLWASHDGSSTSEPAFGRLNRRLTLLFGWTHRGAGLFAASTELAVGLSSARGVRGTQHVPCSVGRSRAGTPWYRMPTRLAREPVDR